MSDILTRLQRGYGLSREDAEKVYGMVAVECEDLIARRRAADAPAQPERLNIMQTVEGVGDNQVVRNWVNVEAVTQEVVSLMVVYVADSLKKVMGEQ